MQDMSKKKKFISKRLFNSTNNVPNLREVCMFYVDAAICTSVDIATETKVKDYERDPAQTERSL